MRTFFAATVLAAGVQAIQVNTETDSKLEALNPEHQLMNSLKSSLGHFDWNGYDRHGDIVSTFFDKELMNKDKHLFK